MKKRLLAVMLSTVMAVSAVMLAGCGDSSTSSSSNAGSGAAEAVSTTGGVFKSVETFMYGSLDPHKEYYSWHTQKYGMTETLFRINDDMEIVPWLAENIEINENKGTVTLKDGLCFSNGNAVTAEMVSKNLLRLAETNKRFAYMAEWTFEAPDDKTLVITTGDKAYPTLMNDLATPETAILDLDATTDFDKNPICTGPFAVENFIPEGDLTLTRNENYWGGDVNCEGALWYSMSDDQSRLMAMQNGEIDACDNITSTDIEIFSAEPETYSLTSVPMQMRAYTFINSKNVPDSVREAIFYIVDRDSIAAFMPGILSSTYGAYDPDVAYGKSQQPAQDLDKAKEIMEADGYTLENGVYTKNGTPVSLTISCYQSRNVDTLAVLLQEQLTKFGIKADIKICADPDSTYMTGDDYDIAFYRMITDKTGDPFPFIDGAVKSGSYQDIAGFGNADTDALIEELRYEADQDKRAELTNEIMTQFNDSHTLLFLVSYNRNCVLRAGASGFNETNPYEFYGIGAGTTCAAK